MTFRMGHMGYMSLSAFRLSEVERPYPAVIKARLATPRKGGLKNPSPEEWTAAWEKAGNVPEVAGLPHTAYEAD